MVPPRRFSVMISPTDAKIKAELRPSHILNRTAAASSESSLFMSIYIYLLYNEYI